MMNGKPRHVFNGSHYRADVRLIIALLLLVYSFQAWRHRRELSTRLHKAENNLRILRQMQDYAQNVCTEKADRKPALDMEKDMEMVRLIKRQDVTRQSVDEDITFILMGPTLKCIHNKLSWIRDRYKKARVFIAVDVGISVTNEQIAFDAAELKTRSHFMGGFSNRAEILNKAIALISTKYFMIVDHSIDLEKTKSNFVEALLSNMPGFDVLSGSEVDLQERMFNIPCYRLRLHNWSFYESYEYNVSGSVLRCDGTSLFFLGRTEAFKHPAQNQLFDTSLRSKWLQDFFISHKDVLEVGVVPEIVIYRRIPDNCFHVAPPPILSLSQKADALLPFVNKHQIFYYDNGTDHLSICAHSRKIVCSEQSIDKKWDNLQNSSGLTTYPFIIESLRVALHFGTRRLEESHLLYVLEGGTLLGLVKLRHILPWDHGDIDTFVYSTRRNVIDMVKKTRRENHYHYWLRHTGFHTYVSNPPDALNGCVVYLTRRIKPKGIIYIRHSGRLFPIQRQVFKFLREFYGSSYFETHMKTPDARSYCEAPGHHACLPDCRWDGCGGGRSAFPGIM